MILCEAVWHPRELHARFVVGESAKANDLAVNQAAIAGGWSVMAREADPGEPTRGRTPGPDVFR